MRLTELRGDVVILACAVSAGIHGALVPDHFDESTEAGFGFVAATLLLAALVVWLTRRPSSTNALTAAAAVLGGLPPAMHWPRRPACPAFTPSRNRWTASLSRPRRSRPPASWRRRACWGCGRPP